MEQFHSIDTLPACPRHIKAFHLLRNSFYPSLDLSVPSPAVSRFEGVHCKAFSPAADLGRRAAGGRTKGRSSPKPFATVPGDRRFPIPAHRGMRCGQLKRATTCYLRD